MLTPVRGAQTASVAVVVDADWWAGRRECATAAVRRWADDNDIAAGMPLETLRQRVGLPAAELLPELLEGTDLPVVDGLAAEPFRAPEADELAELKLGSRELAAAVRAGRLTRIADGVVLGSGALDRAVAGAARRPTRHQAGPGRHAGGGLTRLATAAP